MRNSAWLMGRRGVAALVRLGAMAVLARHLAPADFGLAALAQVAIQFLTLTETSGVATAVVLDREDGWRERLHDAFWTHLSIAAVQTVVALLAIPLVTLLYPHPGLGPLLIALALAFFLRQTTLVPEALLQRELRYATLAMRDSALDLGAALASIALALAGFGVWSLVLPHLLLQPLRIGVSFSLAGFVPRTRPSYGSVRRLLRFALPLAGVELTSLIVNEGDTLLIGRVFGPAALGAYALAWQLANLLSRYVTNSVLGVVTPVLAGFGGDLPRLRSGYSRLLRLLAAVSFPVLVVLGVLAPQLIRLVYGPGWDAVAPLLRVLLVFGVVRSVTAPTQVVYNLAGKPEVGFRIAIAFVPVYLACIVAGSRFGVLGVAWAVTLSRVACALVSLFVSTRLLAQSFLDCVGALGRVTAAAMAMGLALLGAGWLGWIGSGGVALPVAASVAIALYATLLRWLDFGLVRELIRLAREGARLPAAARA